MSGQSVGVRAVVCREYGPPSTLVIEESPDPVPAPGEVVVAVEACGVNFVDALFVAGTYQIRIPPPFTPGFEVAGRVSAIGAGVSGLQVGDRVLVPAVIGGYVSHMVASAAAPAKLPDAFTTTAASTFVQSYSTMWFALTRRCPVEAGETVLVLGAGGGIGLAAVDVAKALGCRVVAAASTEAKLDAARAAGADHTINTTTDDLKARAKEIGVDIAIDPIGGDLADAALRGLRWHGRFVVIGFASGSIPKLAANLVLLNNRTLIGVDWGAWVTRHQAENRAMLLELIDAVGDGRLHPPEPALLPLDDAAAVLQRALDRQIVGKVALVP
jgi:NADPH:quinone reductase